MLKKARVPQDLAWKDLSGQDLSGERFDGADLTGANLEGAKLYGTSFFEATLLNANLRNANLYAAWLHKADCRRADFFNANLRYAKFTDANLEGAKNLIPLNVNDPRGYRPVLVLKEDGWHVVASCRDFTLAEAFEHWNPKNYCNHPGWGLTPGEMKRRKKRAVRYIKALEEISNELS